MRADDLDTALAEAQVAEPFLAASSRPQRAVGLRAFATTLRANQQELVELADTETFLGAQRLTSELMRTAFQLDQFAGLLESGYPTGRVIDPADVAWPPAPRPDLRRRLVPLGVVGVFAAGNFPFAFSVAGGDTASALAAGCPVVVKAHPGHPRLSRRVAQLAREALRDAGLPEGTLSLVEGLDEGRRLVLDDRTDAVAFTGSTAGGRALFDLAGSRPRPIPFYGELGSVNPVFVTERAAEDHGDRIFDELAASFTLGAGQFCTKPGVVFVPRAARGPQELATRLRSGQTWTLLNQRTASEFSRRVVEMTARPDVQVVVAGAIDGAESSATVLRAEVADFLRDPDGLGEESFGPATLLVEYDDERQLVDAARSFVGELTASLQALPDDVVVAELIAALEPRVGRLIWNQWPTGVSVTAAMQHGGPYPASTSSRDTSVGSAAIDRFLRPVAYQNFPGSLLPAELQG